MKFEEIRLENIGPISRATIGCHKLSVFIGPNNSGKSIASRIMHGVRQLDLEATAQQHPASDGAPGGSRDRLLDTARSNAILRSAGIRWRDRVTHTLPSGRLEIANGGSPVKLGFDRGAMADDAVLSAPLRDPAPDGAPRDSMYVPAGRTGTVQSLLAILQIKNELLNSVLDTQAGPPAPGSGSNRTPGGVPQIRLRRRMPDHLEQFYSTVIETISSGLDEAAKVTFSRLFDGTLDASSADGLPSVRYKDPSGFGVEIDLAGSGIVSAFPIVAAMYNVGSGGTLIIEEPEAHIEPLRQLKIVSEIVRAALSRRVDLVLTTHSDYVVNGVLNMVHDEIISPDNLGMYYFRRKKGSFTSVEKIPVDKTGEAEQELFEEALDALAKGGTGGGDS